VATDLDRDAAAYAEARKLGVGGTLFKCIPVNGLFRFAHSEAVHRKLTPKWYCDTAGDGGRRFMTGARSAVFQVHDKIEE
jgi:hypothetical protein